MNYKRMIVTLELNVENMTVEEAEMHVAQSVVLGAPGSLHAPAVSPVKVNSELLKASESVPGVCNGCGVTLLSDNNAGLCELCYDELYIPSIEDAC